MMRRTSENNPARDCLESGCTGRAFLVARSVQNGAPLRRSADSWDPVMEPIRSFQTVSGRRILGSTHKRCCVSPALCRKARPRRPSYDGGRHHPRVPHSPPGWYQSTCPPRRKHPFAACSRFDQSVTIFGVEPGVASLPLRGGRLFPCLRPRPSRYQQRWFPTTQSS